MRIAEQVQHTQASQVNLNGLLERRSGNMRFGKYKQTTHRVLLHCVVESDATTRARIALNAQNFIFWLLLVCNCLL